MTVGVPEISLDTWGLKYVKKGSSPSSITALNRLSDADEKTPDSPKHISGTQGSDKRRTYGADRKERNQQYDIPPTDKLTPKGEAASKNPQNPKGVASGAQASHESGIQSVETRTGKDRAGIKVDPEKKTRQPKSGLPDNTQRSPEHKNPVPTGSGAPKIKAEMELAIIKCKLLKMNDISKRGEWDHLPHAQKEKEEEEKEVKKRLGGTEQEQSPKADDGTPQGAKVSDKEIKDKKLDHVYRSEDIVDKAIELINEAYGEMNKSNPVIVSEHATGKGKPFCSSCGRDNAKEDAKALEGTDDQQQRMVSGTRGGKAPNCPSCGHRSSKKAEDTEDEAGVNLKNVVEDLKETKKYTKEEKDRIEHVTTGEDFDPPTPQKGEHKWVAGNDPHGKPDEYCKTCGKTRTDKDKEAPTSTGDVGVANFVYSDVKEKKKQDKEGKKDKKRFTSEEEEKKRSDKEFLERNRDVQLERND